jgi:RND family efflux transporter MFP subunit
MSTMRFLHGIAGVVALIAMVSCGTEAKSVPSTALGTGPSTPLGAGPEAAVARPPVAVDVVRVAPSDVTETVDVVGSLAPKFVADVKSEVTGVVTAVYVTEWVPVRKGTPLARLDTGETDAAIEALKAVAAQARVVETRARREHDRALELQRYGLITPQALDEARFALEAATAGTAAALAQVRTAEARLAKSFIRAPMDGVVALRRVSVGDRVENMGGGEPMFRIVDNRVLDLTVTVPVSRAADVQVGQALAFTTDAVSGAAFDGRVMFINPAVDEINRSVRVVATEPGQPVEGRRVRPRAHRHRDARAGAAGAERDVDRLERGRANRGGVRCRRRPCRAARCGDGCRVGAERGDCHRPGGR